MRSFDVILLAGGNGDALIRNTGYATKALIPIHGKAMLEWVIEAFRRSASIRHIVVAGPGELDALPAMRHVRRRVPAGRHPWQSLLHGALYARACLQRGSVAPGYLISFCDAVFLTPSVIETAIANVRETDPDVALHYVERSSLARVGTEAHRTYFQAGDRHYTGTSIYFVRRLTTLLRFARDIRVARKLRKHPSELLAALRIAPRSVDDAQRILSDRLSLDARVFVLEHPEAGMDVDKPEDLELARRWLASRPARTCA